MATIDPHIFSRVHERDYLERLPCKPSPVQLIEITENEDLTTAIQTRILDPSQLAQWLEQSESSAIARSQQKPSGQHRVFRLILDYYPLPDSKTQRHVPGQDFIGFPNDSRWHDQRGNSLGIPFSPLHFRNLVEQLWLPRSTAWLCQSSSLHFQSYNMGPGWTGLTLRIANYGIVSLNVALSLSYVPSARTINAVLLGLSPAQLGYMLSRIEDLKDLAFHPAFLPTLLYSYQRSIIQRLVNSDRERLFRVEDQQTLNNAALAVIQLSTAWERYTQSLLLEVGALRDFITTTASSQDGHPDLSARGEILDERLRFVSQKGKEMLFMTQFIKDRASAQISALYNSIGQKGNETSLDIAIASKRDSTAMKSIAVLTMTFLPATFLATYFTTPFVASLSPSQNLFWAVAGSLTAGVLVLWIIWDQWISESDWPRQFAASLRSWRTEKRKGRDPKS